jgi:hypothetical protein
MDLLFGKLLTSRTRGTILDVIIAKRIDKYEKHSNLIRMGR